MAGKTSILSVRIIGDATNATKAFDDAASRAKQFESRMNKAAIGAGVALAGIAGGTKVAIDAASELQQAQGAVASIFGDNADAVAKLGEDAAQRLGLAQAEYANLSALLGAQLSNMGAAADDLAPKTDELISLGADLAATFGGSVSDAVEAVSSLLKGERDPIERYGVSMNQAAVDAKKAELGLTGLTGQAAVSADAQATLAILTEQTAAAHGQFAREADTAAGAQARANAKWQDTIAKLGKQLLPIVTTVTDAFAGFAEWANKNSGIVTALAVTIGAVAAAILGLSIAVKAFTLAQQLQTVAQWASNAAWLASPVTWIIVAIVALIAAVALLWANWEQVWQWMQQAAAAVADWFKSVWDAVASWFQGVWQGVASWFQGVWQGVQNFIGAIGDGISNIWQGVSDTVSGIVTGIGDFFHSIFDGIGNFVKGIANGIANAWNSAMGWIRDVVQSVGDFINGIFSGVGNFVNSVIDGVSGAIGWLGDLIGLSADVPATILPNGVPSIITLASDIPASLQLAASPPAAPLRTLGRFIDHTTGATVAPTVITVNVDGALDPNAVGRQIRSILDRYGRITGAKAV